MAGFHKYQSSQHSNRVDDKHRNFNVFAQAGLRTLLTQTCRMYERAYKRTNKQTSHVGFPPGFHSMSHDDTCLLASLNLAKYLEISDIPIISANIS